jgi:hypothetical protein
MERIEKPALVVAIIGPIQSVLGWTIAGHFGLATTR